MYKNMTTDELAQAISYCRKAIKWLLNRRPMTTVQQEAELKTLRQLQRAMKREMATRITQLPLPLTTVVDEHYTRR